MLQLSVHVSLLSRSDWFAGAENGDCCDRGVGSQWL